MPHHRLLPLLIVGTACMPLAACGSDDEPTASATQMTAPAVTSPATTPGDASANSAPADTTEQPPTDTNPDGAAPSTPSDGSPKDEDAPGATTPPADGSAPDTGPTSPPKSPKDSKDRSGSTPSKDKQPAAQEVPKVLKDYAKGGAPASADEAKSVRDTMLGFQEALIAQDAAKACSYTLGLPAKADPSKPTPSCEALIEGSKMSPPTDKDREMIRTAKITVNGDRASIELDGSGVPMPFRNVDGRWRIDYGTLLGTGGSAK